MNFSDKIKITDLQSLITKCKKYIKIDEEQALATIKNQIDSVMKKKKQASWNEILRLQNQWYNSLKLRTPDYGVYSDPYYLCDIWVCWKLYSRASVKGIFDKKSLYGKSPIDLFEKIGKVIDLGCGMGYTTAYLSEMLPDSEIYGTNIKGSFQYEICRELSIDNRFDIIETTEGIKNVDIIFASEYFEHIYNSLEHLYEIITMNRPRMLVVANAYNGHYVGHFHEYLYNGKLYSAKETSLNFGKMMRHLGYEKLKTNIWNNRPAIWIYKSK